MGRDGTGRDGTGPERDGTERNGTGRNRTGRDGSVGTRVDSTGTHFHPRTPHRAGVGGTPGMAAPVRVMQRLSPGSDSTPSVPTERRQ